MARREMSRFPLLSLEKSDEPDMEDFDGIPLACGLKKTRLKNNVAERNIDCNDCAFEDSCSQSSKAQKDVMADPVVSKTPGSESQIKGRESIGDGERLLHLEPRSKKPAAKEDPEHSIHMVKAKDAQEISSELLELGLESSSSVSSMVDGVNPSIGL